MNPKNRKDAAKAMLEALKIKGQADAISLTLRTGEEPTSALVVNGLVAMAKAAVPHLFPSSGPAATTCANQSKGETGFCNFHRQVEFQTKLYEHPKQIDLEVFRPAVEFYELMARGFGDKKTFSKLDAMKEILGSSNTSKKVKR